MLSYKSQNLQWVTPTRIANLPAFVKSVVHLHRVIAPIVSPPRAIAFVVNIEQLMSSNELGLMDSAATA